jgi:hypothetical protein
MLDPEQMPVAGDDQVGLAINGTFNDPIIVRVSLN